MLLNSVPEFTDLPIFRDNSYRDFYILLKLKFDKYRVFGKSRQHSKKR